MSNFRAAFNTSSAVIEFASISKFLSPQSKTRSFGIYSLSTFALGSSSRLYDVGSQLKLLAAIVYPSDHKSSSSFLQTVFQCSLLVVHINLYNACLNPLSLFSRVFISSSSISLLAIGLSNPPKVVTIPGISTRTSMEEIPSAEKSSLLYSTEIPLG